jgi:hypothetical protein
MTVDEARIPDANPAEASDAAVSGAMELVAELRADEGADDLEAMINISPQTLFVLDAEVRRLRDALGVSNHGLAVADRIEDELRATIREMSTKEGKLHARIAELETELARAADEKTP